jgi:hypothetical protein
MATNMSSIMATNISSIKVTQGGVIKDNSITHRANGEREREKGRI